MKITHQSHEHCFLQWAFQFNSTFKRLIPTSERTTFHCTQLLPARMRSLWNFWGEWNPFETLLAPLTSLWSLHRAFPPPGLLLGILGRGEAPTNPDRCANKGRVCQDEAQFCPSCEMQVQQNKAHSTMSFLSPFLVFFTFCIFILAWNITPSNTSCKELMSQFCKQANADKTSGAAVNRSKETLYTV